MVKLHGRYEEISIRFDNPIGNGFKRKVGEKDALTIQNIQTGEFVVDRIKMNYIIGV